jgi:hypothetical protein
VPLCGGIQTNAAADTTKKLASRRERMLSDVEVSDVKRIVVATTYVQM